MEPHAKKRIIVFIDWYLPGYKAGGPVRSMVNMTEHLSDRFDFYIVTRNSEYGENKPYRDTVPDSWSKLTPGVKVWYCSAGKASLSLWRSLIRQTKADVVYINGIYSPLYSLLPLVAAKSLRFQKVIVAPRGMLADSAIHVKKGKKQLFLKVAKWMNLYRHIRWHVTNEAEASQVRQQINSGAAIAVADNLPRIVSAGFSALEKESGHLRLILPARIAPEKNTLYAIECMKHIPERYRVQLDLYGQIYDQTYWQACEAVIRSLPENVSVVHRGFVEAEEIPHTIRQYHTLFMPTRGENFGHVILESLMAGRPVIISDQTPWQNLQPQKAGRDLPLNDVAGFVNVINDFSAMEQSTYDDWCRGAWQVGRRVADDTKTIEAYCLMFESYDG